MFLEPAAIISCNTPTGREACIDLDAPYSSMVLDRIAEIR